MRKVKADDEVTKVSRRSPRKPQPSKNTGLCDMQEHEKLVIDLCCVVLFGNLICVRYYGHFDNMKTKKIRLNRYHLQT